MTKLHKILFISDLHLDPKYPKQTELFLDFLKNCDASSVDALYILGDLFEAWIGDDDDSLYHQKIIQGLKLATEKGLRIYIMHGNRDFLLGKKFLMATGCQLLPDEYVLNCYQTKILLMHGDTLCTQDVAYLKARKKMRNRLIQQLFLLLPLFIRKKIATKMREKSVHYTQSTLPEIMDVTQTEVERMMQKHHVHYLIHGHTHRPNIHRFAIDNKMATRIILGAWHQGGSVAVWDETGQHELIEL